MARLNPSLVASGVFCLLLATALATLYTRERMDCERKAESWSCDVTYGRLLPLSSSEVQHVESTESAQAVVHHRIEEKSEGWCLQLGVHRDGNTQLLNGPGRGSQSRAEADLAVYEAFARKETPSMSIAQPLWLPLGGTVLLVLAAVFCLVRSVRF